LLWVQFSELRVGCSVRLIWLLDSCLVVFTVERPRPPGMARADERVSVHTITTNVLVENAFEDSTHTSLIFVAYLAKSHGAFSYL